MAPLVDASRRRIVANVRDLVGEPAQRAIGLSGSGLSRLWIGQELHRRVQDEMMATEPGYRAEVHAEAELEVDGWTVVISGRADGVVFDGDRVVRVDEIKTLHFAVDLRNLYADERLERFRHQARVYAWMLGRDGPQPDVRLVLVDIVTSEEQDEAVRWSPDAVEAWIRAQVHRLVTAERDRAARIERLRAAAALLPFPHPERRPAQTPIAEAVEGALSNGRHLLLQAPTGCGKTAAVLHPALRTALAGGHRLVYLTAKTLQQKIAVETVRAMQEDLFTSLQLRAKAKMCANTEIICHEEFCPYAREYGLKLVRSQLLPTLLDGHRHQDPDRVFETARAHELCPFEVSLDLLEHSDVVVCDYNYVFDPTIGLGALLGQGALRDAVLVIDEAHNLVDRGRDYYSPVLGLDGCRRAAVFLATRDNEVFRNLASLVEEVADLIRTTVDAAFDDDRPGDRMVAFRAVDVADLRIAFDAAMLEYFLYKRERDLWMADDPVMDVFLAVTRFHRVLGLGGDEFVHLATRDPDGGECIRILCLDASRFLGEILEQSAGTVAMSATLEPFDFYRTLLGFDPHLTDTLAVPSPFPESNRLVVCIDDVDTTWRRRAEHHDAVAAWIARLAPRNRNALVLFPSYAYLDAVRDRIPPTEHLVVAQEPGASDARQRDVLELLGNGRPHVVLAVLGGIFAEGIDYPGRMLSEVIVVSPGLPQFNADRELLKTYYQETYGHGFSYAYLVPGMTRVIQAAGRLLRSDDDRGVIVLIGRRFTDARYARLLPDDWTHGQVESLLRADPVASVASFFAVED
jgi:DNA excision repair protein ERCC-2